MTVNEKRREKMVNLRESKEAILQAQGNNAINRIVLLKKKKSIRENRTRTYQRKAKKKKQLKEKISIQKKLYRL